MPHACRTSAHVTVRTYEVHTRPGCFMRAMPYLIKSTSRILQHRLWYMFCSSLLISSNFYFFSSFSLSRCNSDPGVTEQALPTSLSPQRYAPSLLSRADSSSFVSPLVDLHRIAPTHAAKRSQQLFPLIFLQINSKVRPTGKSLLYLVLWYFVVLHNII